MMWPAAALFLVEKQRLFLTGDHNEKFTKALGACVLYCFYLFLFFALSFSLAFSSSRVYT